MSEKTNLTTSYSAFSYVYCSIARIFGSSSGWKVATTPDSAYSSLAFGNSISVINSSGQLFSSGRAPNGQMGDNTTISKSSPVQTISGGTNWCQISGYISMHGIKTDGTLWSWGCGASGRMGQNQNSSRSSPVQTAGGGNNWKQTSASLNSIGATKTDGTLWMWGRNLYGQLGDNSTVNRSSPVQTISGGTNWKKFAAGNYSFSAAIKTDGTLWLWGVGGNGRLGIYSNVDRSSPVQTISGGTNWDKVDLGNTTSFAIKTDGSLWSWGNAFRGNLGDGTCINKSSPVQVLPLGTNWRQVSAGWRSVGAIKTDGTLWLWGCNEPAAPLGLGPNYCRSAVYCARQEETLSTDWNEISMSNGKNFGATFSTDYGGGWAAIKCDGTLWGVGSNEQGSFGNNRVCRPVYSVADLGDIFVWKDCFTDAGLWSSGSSNAGKLGSGVGNYTLTLSSPVQTISGGSSWKDLCLANGATFALKNDGTLWAWGCASSGLLGNNNAALHSSSPVQTVAGGTNWRRLSASPGVFTAGGLKTDGTLWLWGCGFCGVHGNNSTINRSSPVQTISGGNDWKQSSIGTGFAAAIKTDGTLWIWGRNTFGQLGINTTVDVSSPIQTLSAGTNWKTVELGIGTVSAIKQDGTLWVWGYNSAQLGDNTSISRSSPVQTIAGGTNWLKIDTGVCMSASIKTDGTLWLWGQGAAGKLGDNTTVNKSSPVQTISAGTDWKEVGLGGCSSGAIKTDGTLWVWGQNNQGQLGDNTSTDKSSPIQTISGGINWKKVSVGGTNIAALREDCW